jgi:hypothetical protein
VFDVCPMCARGCRNGDRAAIVVPLVSVRRCIVPAAIPFSSSSSRDANLWVRRPFTYLHSVTALNLSWLKRSVSFEESMSLQLIYLTHAVYLLISTQNHLVRYFAHPIYAVHLKHLLLFDDECRHLVTYARICIGCGKLTKVEKKHLWLKRQATLS